MSHESKGTPPSGGVPLLVAEGICKTFGEHRANDDISLRLAAGEILCLLGENGAGKTTLMNILFGHYVADAGTITVAGQPLPPGSTQAALRAGIGMVHQHFTLAGGLTVLENVVLGTQSLWSLRDVRANARVRLQTLMNDVGLRVDLDALVDTLPVGQRQRVEILKVLYRQARVLILDEPTAILSPQECDGLFTTLRALAARGLAVILISHKLEDVMRISDRIAVLRDGRLVGEVAAAKAKRDDLVRMMIGRSLTQVSKGTSEGNDQDTGEPVLVLRKVSVRKGRDRLCDVSVSVRQGEILGIAGISGNGQSLLADVIYGLVRPDQGEVRLYGEAISSTQQVIDAGVGRICEDRLGTGMIAGMSVAENAASTRRRIPPFARWGWYIDNRAVRARAQDYQQQFDVRCRHIGQPIAELSGGNIQKLILARELADQPRFILAHQPSRGLDAGAIAFVHECLIQARKQGAGILLMSEDLDELLALSDQVAVIFEGTLSAPLARDEATVSRLGLLMIGHADEIENEKIEKKSKRHAH
ncbi:MAG: ABC transporter ATP-binding protein [Pseudomonadota bacterium]